MNCSWNISFMLGSLMQKFLPVANWKSSSCSPLSLPPGRKDLIVGALSHPHLSCTLLGASSRQLMCLSARGSLAAMRIPEEERKKRTMIKQAPKGGLQPPGTMENGAYMGSRGSGQGLLSWRGTDDSCEPPSCWGAWSSGIKEYLSVLRLVRNAEMQIFFVPIFVLFMICQEEYFMASKT